MGTHPVFDDSFALEDAVVCLSDIALKLMIGLCTIAGASNRLSDCACPCVGLLFYLYGLLYNHVHFSRHYYTHSGGYDSYGQSVKSGFHSVFVRDKI